MARNAASILAALCICYVELLAGAYGAPLTVDYGNERTNDDETEEGVVNERPEAETEQRASATRGKPIGLVALADYVGADQPGNAYLPTSNTPSSADACGSPNGVVIDEYTRRSNHAADRCKNHRRHRLINGVSGAGDRLVSRRADANWRPLPCSPIASTRSAASVERTAAAAAATNSSLVGIGERRRHTRRTD